MAFCKSVTSEGQESSSYSYEEYDELASDYGQPFSNLEKAHDSALSDNCQRFVDTLFWMMNHPDSPSEFLPAVGGSFKDPDCEATLALYVQDAQEILKRLNTLDLEYRQYGLFYHTIPLGLRQGRQRYPDRVAPNPTTIARMAQVFACSQSREDSDFFLEWFGAAKAATTIIQKVAAAKKAAEEDNDMWAMKDAEFAVRDHIQTAATELRSATARLNALKTMIYYMELKTARMNVEEDLTNEYGVAGLAFRIWISTFPEVERGEKTVVYVAEVMMALHGVEEVTWWSGEYGAGDPQEFVYEEEVEEPGPSYDWFWYDEEMDDPESPAFE